MANKLPSGTWRSSVFVGYDDKGKRIYKYFLADSRQSADLLALQWKAEHKEDKVTGKTFAIAAKDYADLHNRTLSPSTQREYNNYKKAIARDFPKFSRKAIKDISKADLQDVVNKLSSKLAPKSVRNYYGYICSVLRGAGITPPKCDLPQKVKTEYNIPDEETLTKLFKASQGTEWEVPILLGAIVPMRRGEICGTDPGDLSDDNVLHIHASMVRGIGGKISKKSPKTTESDRYVELPQVVADKIRAQGYVCSFSLDQFTKAFRKFLLKNGFEPFRFHDLRHAFVSIAHAAGIPDAYIMSRGGWATSYTVNNVYRHVLDSDRRKAERIVNDVFSSFFSSP